jgi:pyrimidine-nucleoside phosphorylase
VTVLSHNTLEDKISLVLVPLMASAGLRILKSIWSDILSGHALLDNLLSIPGITLPSNPEDIDRLLERIGGAYASVPEFAPLYKEGFTYPNQDEITRFKVYSLFTLYAIDWDGIAVDIRVGDYSNLIKTQNAQDFWIDLKEHCNAAGIGSSFFISNLEQPLGHALGPILELQEAIDVLKAKGPFDFTKLAIEQGADLLMHAGKFTDRTLAKSFLKKQLQNGAALNRFKDIVKALKGTAEVTDDLYPFPLAKRNLRIVSHKKGYIHRIAMDRLFDLKHRLCSEHKGAGVLLLKKIGDTTDKNDTLAEAYLPSSWDAQLIQTEVQDIFSISQFPPEFQPLITEKIKGSFRF